MIIGKGMMAKAFSHKADNLQQIIFASGVSDSSETRQAEFLREENLLRATMRENPKQKLVYFSTCSIYDSTLHNSPYIHHKLNMERVIRENCADYVIFRLPQVVGVTQSPTLIHYLYQKIYNQQRFDLWGNSKRNLIDVADVVRVVDFILDNQLFSKLIVNLASDKSHSIYEIVMILERLTEKRALYNVVDKGSSYHIDLSQIKPILKQLNMQFGANYAENVITKYYPRS